MKPLLLAFVTLLAAAAGASGACLTDTSQTDFQAGAANAVDVNATPGAVVLTKSFAVDQQNSTLSSFGTPFDTSNWVGQTFTSGLSGRLTRVDIKLFCVCSGTSPSLVVGLRNTSGGLPVGGDLASATIPSISTGGGAAFYSAIFSSPATLTAGTQYALIVRPTTNPASNGQFGILRSGTSAAGLDVYAGGALLNSANSGASWVVQSFVNPDPTKTSADSGFMTFIHGGYSTSGDLTSAPRDSNPPAGAVPSWTTLSWTASTPADTGIAFQVGASNSSNGPFNFVGPDGTSGTFFSVSGASLSQFNAQRFLKYRAYLSSNSSTATPTLNDVSACYSTTSNADLTISNSDGVSTTTAGSQVTYTISVANTGPSGITGAMVSDAFPPALTCLWSCAITGSGNCTAQGWGNIGDSINLGSGSSAVYTAVCAIAANATGTVGNTASVAEPAGVADPDPNSNSATDMDTLDVVTNVAMTLDDGSDFVQLGDVLDYVIELTNVNGPSDAVVNVADMLPPQLAAGAWVCSGSGSAICHNGSGNTLGDSATVPVGGKIDYIYSASVIGEDAMGMVANDAAATLQFGSNQPSNMISAGHSDTVVVFRTGFETPAAAPLAVTAAADGSSSLRLGVDSGLLAQAGMAPVTLASGYSASGALLFRLQLARAGKSILLRAVLEQGDGVGIASAWRPADLRQGLLELAWQPQSGRPSGSGALTVSAAGAPLTVAHDRAESLARLQVGMDGGIAWLVPLR
jgi:uncharacterized repeat protein (TIGR01451 family)